MSAYFTPIEVCEALFGGIEQIAAITGQHLKTPYHWRHASRDRDAGDIPSARLMRRLLEHSAERDLGLTADHLIRGATRAEIAAILDARVADQVAAQ